MTVCLQSASPGGVVVVEESGGVVVGESVGSVGPVGGSVGSLGVVVGPGVGVGFPMPDIASAK